MKALIKLFSDAAQAETAVRELKAKGYQDAELGVLAAKAEQIQRVSGGLKTGAGQLAGAGPVLGAGTLSAPVAQADPGAALAEIWGLPQQSIDYYAHGVLKGGTVVSVHVDQNRAEEARRVLRAVAPNTIEQVPEEARKSGFQLFDRMTESNVVDRQLSGDFRKY